MGFFLPKMSAATVSMTVAGDTKLCDLSSEQLEKVSAELDHVMHVSLRRDPEEGLVFECGGLWMALTAATITVREVWKLAEALEN
jgi:hypothetical protein